MVEQCGDILAHTHIANPVGRVPMTPQDTADYKAFFRALHFIGYNARMSLECPVRTPKPSFPLCLRFCIGVTMNNDSFLNVSA